MVGSLIYFTPIFYSVRVLIMTFFIELFMYELIQRLTRVALPLVFRALPIYIYIELMINFYTYNSATK